MITSVTLVAAARYPGRGQPDDEIWFGTVNSADPFRRTTAPPAEFGMIANPAVGDFDGNGETDIYWHGQNDGNPRDSRRLRVNGTWVKSEVDSFVDGGTPFVADLNGDGLDDVVVHYDTWLGGDGVAAVRWGSRTAPIEQWRYLVDAQNQLLHTPPGATLGLADIDGDGRADIRIFPPTPSPWGGWSPRWMSRGDGSFVVPDQADWSPGDAGLARVSTGDIDGDGYGHMLADDPATGKVTTLFNLGGGYASQPGSATLSTGSYRAVLARTIG
jgi:hypothetical protein